MIVSFRDADTEGVFEGRRSKKFPPTILRSVQRKLWMVDAATTLADLKVPPGNRLEKLRGEYAGYHSVRINDQWRICFSFEGGNARDVEITDYH